MLTNEQRAHDLAVSIVQWQLDHIKETIPKDKMQAGADGKLTAQIDVYKMYTHYYTSMLRVMNRDYPGHNEEQ